MIRRLMGGTARAAAVAAIALACLAAAGCGQEDVEGLEGDEAPSMTDEDYITHMAALTIAVEEGLTGAAAQARAVELGSGGHSREEVEEFAADLRTRPERWLELEKEVDRRIVELRRRLAADEMGAAER